MLGNARLPLKVARANDVLGECWRAELDETVDVVAQKPAAPHRYARRAFLEEVRTIEKVEPRIAIGSESHRREDADAEPEIDIVFDYVGIESRHGDVGDDSRPLEGLVDARAPRKPFVIGNDRPFRHVLER